MRAHLSEPAVARRALQFFHDLAEGGGYVDMEVGAGAAGEMVDGIVAAVVRHGGISRENGSTVLLLGLQFLTQVAFGPEGCGFVNGVAPMILGVATGHWDNRVVVVAALSLAGKGWRVGGC